jgi:hypothetical protein
MFIEKYKNNEFEDFINTGIMSQEMVTAMIGEKENVKVEENVSSNEGISTDINKGNTGIVESDNGSVRGEQP